MSNFRLLGPLEVGSRSGAPVRLGGVRPRRLLAALLINRGAVSSVDQLIDAVWADEPPNGAAVTLRSYVAQVRRLLAEADCGAELTSRGGGYVLTVAATDLDSERFERLVAQGRRAAAQGDHGAAADLFTDALDLWRGDVLADLTDADFARAHAARLDDLRLAAWEGEYTARLADGDARRILPDLAELAVRYPLYEPFTVLLARAQYRAGRPTDALDTVTAYRARLRDELGVDPGAQLRELEGAVLRQDPALDEAPSKRSPTSASPASTGLIERDGQIRELSAAVRRAIGGRGGFVAVCGDAGIGKTSLVRSVTSTVTGARVLVGQCDHLGLPRPFGPLRDVAAALSVAALEPGESANITRVCEDALAALRAEPTILVIEDVHWLDIATADVLLFLLRRLSDVPVLVVVTYREHEVGLRDPVRTLLGELASSVGHVRIGLEPLSFDGVRSAIGSASLDPERVLNLTGGNPYFVTHVCADPDRPLPATVRDTLLARLSGLTQEDVDVLRLAAIARIDLSHPALRRLGALPGTLERLGATGLISVDATGIRFQHELARMAVVESIVAGAAPVLHARLLSALEAEGADAATLTHHAVEAHDPATAVRHAVAAGQEASRSGAHHDAVAFFEVALQHQSSTTDLLTRATLLQQLATEKYMTGRLDDALEVASSALELWQRCGSAPGLAAAYDFCAVLEYFNANRSVAESDVEEAVAVARSNDAVEVLGSAQATRGFLAYLRGDLAVATSDATSALAVECLPGEAASQDRRSKQAARAELIRTLAELASGDVTVRERLLKLITQARVRGWDELASTGYSQLA